MTNIGDNAFQYCNYLETVYTYIGDGGRVKEMMRGKGVDVDTLTFAEYEPTRYTVSLNDNLDGLQSQELEVVEGSTLDELPTFDRNGYAFLGWFSQSEGGDVVPAETHVLSNITLYAHWDRKEIVDMLPGLMDVGCSGNADWLVKWTGMEWWLQSGEIGDRESSALSASVSGTGTLSFSWKVSSDCEEGYKDDYLSFMVDDVEVEWIGGEKGWLTVRAELGKSDLPHIVKWLYIKDKSAKAGSDCGWLKDVTWTPAEPIPPVASDDDVAPALAGTADANVAANVTNAAQYASYRVWALSVTNATTTVQMIKESTRTWLSYALGTDTLIDREFTSDDVKIESFAPTSADGRFEFSVSLKDVNIGGGAVAVETLKENLKKVLGLEGAATLDLGAFSSDNIDISFETPVDGKARFTAKPPAGAGNSFFMRVKVKK